jgi:two-component system response regulator EvgA
LIVDDHVRFCATARELLETAGFEVIAEAHDGASALDTARMLQPDLVLLDVMLPDKTGFEVADRLRTTIDAPIVILTSTRERGTTGPGSNAAGSQASCTRPTCPGRPSGSS